jgi:S-DNA-T family DNA segregation ATPase FtsK/SpoIIIE
MTTIIVLAVIVVDFDIQTTFDRVRRFMDWLHMTLTGKAGALNTAFKAEREAAIAEYAASDPAATQISNASPEVKSRRTAQPDRGPVAPGSPPQPLHVSISRQQDEPEPWIVSPPQEDDGSTPRSNGTISRDAIEGLGGLPGPLQRSVVAKGAETAASVIAAVDAQSGNAARKNKMPIDEDESGPKRAEQNAVRDASENEHADVAIADVVANEHERKAVQAAVARKVMQSEGAADADALNKELAEAEIRYKFPTPDLLDRQVNTNTVTDAELRNKAAQVKEKLAVFGIGIESISVTPGPVVTLFELVPDSSVKISKITSLADDLALALAAKGIRIIAPIPGKSAVGIEIPNNAPELVNFRSVVTAPEFSKSRHKLTLGLGKSITGDVVCVDLARMPHLLIAGATGSGKSVGINVMITSLLYRMKPQQVKFVMIDPKKIELAQYRGLSRHFLATCPDIDEEIITDPANAVIVLKSLELEMDMRYTKLAKAGVRHVDDYNIKVQAGQVRDSELVKHYQLPYIVVIIDELADLMITAAREVEEPIARLAQLARAVGIHLVLATQRPSVDVITGVIKANFPARIAYQVSSRIDSRTVIDGSGADQLLGNGDMLYLPAGQPKPVRIQNAFLSTEEVERVVEFISDQHGFQRPYTLPSVRSQQQKSKSREDEIGTDDLMFEAARLIVRHQQGSVSLLQRRLKIGYSRAARIVDQLEMAGIVGPYDGSKARQVMVEDEEQLEDILQTL